MKYNWKILLAMGLIIAAIILGITSLFPSSHNGSDLNIPLGKGTVTVNNASDQPQPAQLRAKRTFAIDTTLEDVFRRSSSQVIAGTSTQVLELMLPVGSSEFTVTSGTDVSFVSLSDTALALSVKPFNDADTTLRLLVALITILASLFYISRTTNHNWISAARRRRSADVVTAQEAEQDNFDRILARRGSKKPSSN